LAAASGSAVAAGVGYATRDRWLPRIYPGETKPEIGKGYRFDKNGWTYIHIEGDPHERGYQHGYLVAPELQEILRSLKYLTYWNSGMQWEFFVDAAEKLFVDLIDQEFLDEIKGIADGAKDAGVDVTWQEILAWNGYEELTDYWWPNVQEGKLDQNINKEH
jgi:hypothetical protein